MFYILALLIINGNNANVPVLTLSCGTGENGVYIFDSRTCSQKDVLSYGPLEYRVDAKGNIYVHDINVTDGNHINRIIKFDTTGTLQLVIDSNNFSEDGSVWFGPMTLDPANNNLLILGSKNSTNGDINSLNNREMCVFIFSDEGQSLGVKNIDGDGGTLFLYNYNNKFYIRSVDVTTEYDSELELLKILPKEISRGRGYSQWTDWQVQGTDEKHDGTFVIKLGNVNNNTARQYIFSFPPYQGIRGFVEGEDLSGNIYINAYKGNLIRINPSTKSVAAINLFKCGIPKSVGDVAHGTFISPSGNVYKATLVRDDKNKIQYNIYRINPEMFQKIKEVEVKEWGVK